MMRSTLRRTLLATGTLVAVTALALSPIDDLNEAVAKQLAPLNNQLTKTEIVFTDLEVNEKRALKAGVRALYSKKGALSDLLFEIPNLSYSYHGNMDGPEVNGSVSAKLNLPALVDQETINEMGEEVFEILQEMGRDMLQDYGQAASFELKLKDSSYDENGNLVRVIGQGKVTVDLEKLPSHVDRREVEIIFATLELEVGLEKLAVNARVIMNREYRAFEKEETGLKEAIELLLAQDDDSLREISEVMTAIDQWIARFLNEGMKDINAEDK